MPRHVDPGRCSSRLVRGDRLQGSPRPRRDKVRGEEQRDADEPPELEELLARMELVPRGPNTITRKAALRAELARIRKSGVAVNNEELAYGLRSVAAPVYDRSGEVTAALNLAVHRTMLSTEDLVERYAPSVQRTAAAISAELGYR